MFPSAKVRRLCLSHNPPIMSFHIPNVWYISRLRKMNRKTDLHPQHPRHPVQVLWVSRV